MGVNVFFALSGFLITTLLLRERSRRGSISLRSFYVRRILRIFPVYYVAVAAALLGIVLGGDRYLRPFGMTRAELDLPLVAASHLTFLANWVSVKLPTTLDVLWSVSIEEQFYLVFPAAILLSRTNRGAMGAIAAGLACCWITRGWLVVMDPAAVYRNTLAHGDHLLLGALAATLTQTWPETLNRILRRLGRMSVDAVALALIVLLAIVESRAPLFGGLLFIDYLVSAALCALLVAVAATNTSWLSRLLARPTARFLGQLTYAGYVFHIYCVAIAWFVMARITDDIGIAAPARTALAIPLTFAVAWVSRLTLEKRAMMLKTRFERT